MRAERVMKTHGQYRACSLTNSYGENFVFATKTHVCTTPSKRICEVCGHAGSGVVNSPAVEQSFWTTQSEGARPTHRRLQSDPRHGEIGNYDPLLPASRD